MVLIGVLVGWHCGTLESEPMRRSSRAEGAYLAVGLGSGMVGLVGVPIGQATLAMSEPASAGG